MFIELSETSADVQSESLDDLGRYRIVLEDNGPRRVENGFMQPLQLPTTPVRLCCCRSKLRVRLEESNGSMGRLSSLEASESRAYWNLSCSASTPHCSTPLAF